MLKIGDILFCHKPVIYRDSKKCSTTVNKKYEVMYIDIEHDEFVIIDDDEHDHWFDFDTYRKWFCLLTEYRKKKLEQIK